MLWGAPFLVLGARAFVGVQKGPELSLFLLSLVLVSAWVGMSILLVGSHAGGVVVDIYNVVVVVFLIGFIGCQHWGSTGPYDFWFLVGYNRQP